MENITPTNIYSYDKKDLFEFVVWNDKQAPWHFAPEKPGSFLIIIYKAGCGYQIFLNRIILYYHF